MDLKMPPGAKRLEQLSNPVHTVDSNRNPDIRSTAGRWWKAKTEEDMLQEKKKIYIYMMEMNLFQPL